MIEYSFLFILILVLCFIYYKNHKIQKRLDSSRNYKYQRERQIITDEYTSGKYDFATFKHKILDIQSKYHIS